MTLLALLALLLPRHLFLLLTLIISSEPLLLRPPLLRPLLLLPLLLPLLLLPLLRPLLLRLLLCPLLLRLLLLLLLAGPLLLYPQVLLLPELPPPPPRSIRVHPKSRFGV